jgi:hypothetical protein
MRLHFCIVFSHQWFWLHLGHSLVLVIKRVLLPSRINLGVSLRQNRCCSTYLLVSNDVWPMRVGREGTSSGVSRTLISGIGNRDKGCGSVGIDYRGKLTGNYTEFYWRNITQDFYCSTTRHAVGHPLPCAVAHIWPSWLCLLNIGGMNNLVRMTSTSCLHKLIGHYQLSRRQ